MRQQNTRFWRIIILDAEVLEWLKAQPLGWQHELNNLARFYMETSNAPLARAQSAGSAGGLLGWADEDPRRALFRQCRSPDYAAQCALEGA